MMIHVTRLGASVTQCFSVLSFSSAALTNQAANIGCQQYQGSKAATSQNASSLSFFFQVLTADKAAKKKVDNI